MEYYLITMWEESNQEKYRIWEAGFITVYMRLNVLDIVVWLGNRERNSNSLSFFAVLYGKLLFPYWHYCHLVRKVDSRRIMHVFKNTLPAKWQAITKPCISRSQMIQNS